MSHLVFPVIAHMWITKVSCQHGQFWTWRGCSSPAQTVSSKLHTICLKAGLKSPIMEASKCTCSHRVHVVFFVLLFLFACLYYEKLHKRFRFVFHSVKIVWMSVEMLTAWSARLTVISLKVLQFFDLIGIQWNIKSYCKALAVIHLAVVRDYSLVVLFFSRVFTE